MLFGQRSPLNPQVFNPFAGNLLGYSEIGLNVFDLVDSSIRKGPNSIVFGNFFSAGTFKIGSFALNLKSISVLSSDQ